MLVSLGLGCLVGLASSCAPDIAAQQIREVRMPASKTLVVFYSRTGNTEKVARAIAAATGADLEALVDTVDRAGLVGFLRALKDAFTKGETRLQPLTVDPTQYDLVIIGTPDWGQSVSSPARSFMKAHHGRLRQVAFFLTDGHSDHAVIFKEMEQLVGRAPVATLGIPGVDVQRGEFAAPVATFVGTLR